MVSAPFFNKIRWLTKQLIYDKFNRESEAAMTTTRIKFVKKTHSSFFNLLGVQYGVLVTVADGKDMQESILIVDMEGQMKSLRDSEREGVLTSDEVDALEKDMKEAGLENMTAVFDKARQFPIPEDYSPLYRFKTCSMPNCRRLLAHGNIFNKDGARVQQVDTISTLAQGRNVCEYAARYGGDYKLDAVIIFKQMLEANLALNDIEFNERYDALPEDVRRENEEEEYSSANWSIDNQSALPRPTEKRLEIQIGRPRKVTDRYFFTS